MEQKSIDKVAEELGIPQNNFCKRLTSGIPLDGSIYDMTTDTWEFDIAVLRNSLSKEITYFEKMNKGQLISMKTLSDMLSMHKNTIIKWTKRGMPFVKKSPVMNLLDLEEVIKWLDQQGIKYEGYARLLREHLKKLDV